MWRLFMMMICLGTGPALAGDEVSDLPLVERWRAGGDDDEVFFGNVLQVLPAPGGGVYVLDSQLVKVFQLDDGGRLVAVLGGAGEGPGEVANVNSIVSLPDGTLGLGQVLPGVVARLRADGSPAGKIRIRDREDPDSSFVLYLTGQPLGRNLLAGVMRWRMDEQGGMTQDMYLRSYDLDGVPLVDFLHKQTAIDMAAFRFDESGFDFVWNRFGVLPDGNLCFAPERNRYEIRVCRPDGTVLRTVTRPYRSWRRDAAAAEEARLSAAAIASQYGRPVQGVSVEATEPDITALAVLADGRLWVRTSRGDRERPDGVLTVVDEFDAAGRFLAQRRLLAAGDPTRDAVYLLPDGRVVVVTGAVEAYRREQNTERSAAAAAAETPLEVICYGPAVGKGG